VLDATAAVAIADGLLNELEAATCSGGPITSTPLDLAYLDRLGVSDRLPGWRQAAHAVHAAA
jgi:hypothetical protein